MPLTLKPEYNNVVIGFNNSSLPLGQRNDLIKLYELAKLKNHRAHLEMFDEVPSQEEIDAAKEKAFNEKQRLKRSRFNQKAAGSKA